jgi:hypothetical protein
MAKELRFSEEARALLMAGVDQLAEFGPLDEGLTQPSPDSSTPQSLGLGPSIG